RDPHGEPRCHHARALGVRGIPSPQHTGLRGAAQHPRGTPGRHPGDGAPLPGAGLHRLDVPLRGERHLSFARPHAAPGRRAPAGPRTFESPWEEAPSSERTHGLVQELVTYARSMRSVCSSERTRAYIFIEVSRL